MSDRFDHALEHKLKTKPPSDGDDEPVATVRRFEVITGTGRRRRWSGDEKAVVVAESLKPGVNVSEVARRHGVSPQQLFGWRRQARALFDEGTPAEPAALAISSSRSTSVPAEPPSLPAFASVIVASNPHPASVGSAVPPSSPPASPTGASAQIEIVIGDCVVRVIGRIETERLIPVLAAVRSAS